MKQLNMGRSSQCNVEVKLLLGFSHLALLCLGLFICMFFLNLYMSLVPIEVRKGYLIPKNWNYNYELNLNLGLPQEPQVFLI